MSRDWKNPHEEMNYTYTQMESLIDEYIVGKRAKRDRAILRMYFLDGLTYEEIAENIGMSSVQVGRIVRKQGDKLLLMIQK